MSQSQAPALTWTTTERESLFTAIARHRRAAARVRLISDACALALALVVAVLMSPIFYAVLGLALDLLNFLIPMPNLIGTITDTVSALIDDPTVISAGRWIYLLVVAALPGLALMTLAIRSLGRVIREAMSGDAATFTTRAPNGTVLSEQRFVNVVAEMAIAAGLTAPRVLVADTDAVNAAAFGGDAAHASIVVTTGLLAELNREELQGVAADVVGAIANGDMTIGVRVATILSTFGLVAKLGDSFANREAARRFLRLLRNSWRHGASCDDGELTMVLTNPFESAPVVPDVLADDKKIPWRTFAWMPLVGPLVISGFFGGVLCAFALGPLLSLSWRQRRYLADATAVQLTRDPNILGSALEKMRGTPVQGAFSAWIAHLCVMPSGLIGAKSIFGGSSVPMAPSLDRRLKALGILGAQVAPRSGRQLPFIAWCVLAPVLALIAGLMSVVVVGLLYISVALSGMFTWLPVVILHALLR